MAGLSNNYHTAFEDYKLEKIFYSEHKKEYDYEYGAQFIGAFQPLEDVLYNLSSYIIPYSNSQDIQKDIMQPLKGVLNIIRAISITTKAALTFSLLAATFPFWILIDLMLGGSVSSAGCFSLGYEPSLRWTLFASITWMIDGIASFINGVSQIALTPFTWFVKIPLRAMLSSESIAVPFLVFMLATAAILVLTIPPINALIGIPTLLSSVGLLAMSNWILPPIIGLLAFFSAVSLGKFGYELYDKHYESIKTQIVTTAHEGYSSMASILTSMTENKANKDLASEKEHSTSIKDVIGSYFGSCIGLFRGDEKASAFAMNLKDQPTTVEQNLPQTSLKN